MRFLWITGQIALAAVQAAFEDENKEAKRLRKQIEVEKLKHELRELK